MTQQTNDRWAVVLAGGDGNRLRPLTHILSGDERPKQFCRILGKKTLLADTVDRLSQVIPHDRILFVVSQRHEAYYREELAGVPRDRVIEQPINRGTTAAVVAALMRLRRLASGDPVVGFFPADHHYSDPAALAHAITRTYAVASAEPSRVVLIGARATGPDTDFGWIEPGEMARVPGRPAVNIGRLHQVARFVEKPGAEVAQRLFEGGSWWNTFISVARASAFGELIATTATDVWRSFEAAPDMPLARQPDVTRVLYATLPISDFSRDVLSARPGALSAVGPLDAGWTDLGQPHRVLDTLARRGLPRPNLLRRVAG
jgi:mannose-1-phosphate guanylyltransferase